MSEQSIRAAAEYYKEGLFGSIIISTAYEDVWWQEKMHKMMLLRSLGVELSKVESIGPVTSSYDEIEGISKLVRALNIGRICLIADEHHAPRALEALKATFPKLGIDVRTFTTSVFEKAYEPHPIKVLGLIKGWRAGHKWSWILWNKTFSVLGRVMMAIKKPKAI